MSEILCKSQKADIKMSEIVRKPQKADTVDEEMSGIIVMSYLPIQIIFYKYLHVMSRSFSASRISSSKEAENFTIVYFPVHIGF